MAQVVNKQNMTIAIREYQDNQGQTKKVWKTVGEITTWDDGSMSWEMWSPTGSTTGQVFDKQGNNQQQGQQQQQQGGWGQPQQPQQQQQQGGWSQPKQQQYNNQRG